MNDNDNSVNIDSGLKPYHHGDLRNALVMGGLKVLSQNKSGDFSLREVARNVGVSATSVYRHFSDKQTFIEALCAEGSKMLAIAQKKAMTASGGGQEGLDATGLAYVHFALANPTLFQLMRKARSGIGNATGPAIQELQANIATLLPRDTSEREQYTRALHAWSVVHGITMLLLEGNIPEDDELIKAIIKNPKT